MISMHFITPNFIYFKVIYLIYFNVSFTKAVLSISSLEELIKLVRVLWKVRTVIELINGRLSFIINPELTQSSSKNRFLLSIDFSRSILPISEDEFKSSVGKIV